MNASGARLNLVAARSPAVDRRSLSQAWYSALHIAGREPPARSARGRSAVICHPERSERSERSRGTAVTLPLRRCPSTTSTLRSAYARDDKQVERRALPPRLARDIAAKIKANPYASRFFIETPRGRVIVHVLRRDDRVHLVALCGAALRDDVEKALAQARFALAGIGVAAR